MFWTHSVLIEEEWASGSSSNRSAPLSLDILGNSIDAVLLDLLARIGSHFDRVVTMESLSYEGRLSDTFHYLGFPSVW